LTASLAAACGGLGAQPPAAGAPTATSGLTQDEAAAWLTETWRRRSGAQPDPSRVREEVRLAFEARRRFPWGTRIPDELFLEAVLPPIQLDEADTPWRADLLSRFAPLVADAETSGEAAVRLNAAIWQPLGIGYTDKPIGPPMVTPTEACALGKVNCTGLAIVFADACRALAIPARVAGIPAWWTPPDAAEPVRGYHQWVEIWDGSWRFLSAIDPSELDRAWFAERAAKTDVTNPAHRIYAARFALAGSYFPLPWRMRRQIVPGVDVTPFYTRRRRVRVELRSGQRFELRWQGMLVAAGEGPDAMVSLAAGESYAWSLVDGAGQGLESGDLLLDDSPEPRLRLPAAEATDAQAGHSAIR